MGFRASRWLDELCFTGSLSFSFGKKQFQDKSSNQGSLYKGYIRAIQRDPEVDKGYARLMYVPLFNSLFSSALALL